MLPVSCDAFGIEKACRVTRAILGSRFAGAARKGCDCPYEIETSRLDATAHGSIGHGGSRIGSVTASRAGVAVAPAPLGRRIVASGASAFTASGRIIARYERKQQKHNDCHNPWHDPFPCHSFLLVFQ
jgi:hypothetical protein